MPGNDTCPHEFRQFSYLVEIIAYYQNSITYNNDVHEVHLMPLQKKHKATRNRKKKSRRNEMEYKI